MSFVSLIHQYEYQVVEQNMNAKKLEEFLNLAGKNGWKLHTINEYIIILEREL